MIALVHETDLGSFFRPRGMGLSSATCHKHSNETVSGVRQIPESKKNKKRQSTTIFGDNVLEDVSLSDSSFLGWFYAALKMAGTGQCSFISPLEETPYFNMPFCML